MDNNMTESEFEALRQADRELEENQGKVDVMSLKEFLTFRSTEVIKVPIRSTEGTKYIDVWARMSRADTQKHELFLSKFKAASKGDIDALVFLSMPDGDKATAAFLAEITCDPELDTAFWLSDVVDHKLAQSILLAYFRSNQ